MKKSSLKAVIMRILSLVITSILIFVLCYSLYFSVERKLYPLKYQEYIKYYSDLCNLDFYLVISLIKIESDFNQKAVSIKGAKGLMQLMDSTSKYVADMIGKDSYDVFNERDNIELGCHYLQYLLKKFPVTSTALCAYNAGEGNVSDWLGEKSLSQDGLNLAVIPFRETREYIVKFEKTFSKYKKLYKNIVDKK